jgi:alcohol dehydrogenase
VVSIQGLPDAETAMQMGLPLPLRIGAWLATLPIRRRARRHGARWRFLFMWPSAEELGALGQLADDGKLRAVIDREHALDEVGAALAYVATGKARGKVVLRMK